MQLEFAKSHHKITLSGKVGVALGYGSSQKLGVFSLIFLQCLKLQWMFLINGII